MIQSIVPPGTRPPAGHYSPAIVHQGLVYVSGQLPIDPVTGEHEKGSITAQTERVLRNLQLILQAAGSSKSRVLQVTIYMSSVDDWPEINRIYAEFFGEHRPARAVVPTPPLHFGFAIELSAVAAVEPS